MKKIAALLSISTLAACVYAGDISVIPPLGKIFTAWQTESITYYDVSSSQEYLMDSKTVTEENVDRGEILVTGVGEIMASSQTRRTDFYGLEKLTVNRDAVLSSSYSPLYVDKNAKFEPFGQARVDGKDFMLVRQDNENDILLVSPDGVLYNKIGRIRDNRLAVLEVQFFIEPDDVIFMPVVNTRSETTGVISGFELRYEGLEGDTMRFTYTTLGENSLTEEFTFSSLQQTIDIKNFKINVLNVDYNNIEYVIL